MDILIRYGFSIEEIKNMMDTNEDLANILDSDVLELINLLTDIGCHEEHIMNIFTCNPFVLSNDLKEVKNLIKKLKELKFNNLYIIFDSNPYLLNMNSNEVEELYNKKKKNDLTHDEICEYFYQNIIL